MLPLAIAIGIALSAAATADESRPVYSDRQTDPAMLKIAAEMRDAGKLLTSETLLPQLKSPKCKLTLPPVRTQKLAGRAIWAAARRSYIRVGWFYQCSKCDRWHLDLAGGYAITADGAVATCYHVAETPAKFVKGYMVAATDDGRVFPAISIVAANAKSDACIIRVKSDIPLIPMPLSDSALPGDTVYCFSDPMGFRGYFSQGMVNRYYRESPRKRNAKNTGKTELEPLSLNVSTDWAPGSSGAAIIDECGNAIGHVARIMPVEEAPRKKNTDGAREDTGTLMVLHNAVPAQEVLALIERQ